MREYTPAGSCRNAASVREAVSTKAFQEIASMDHSVRMQPATRRSLSKFAQSRSTIANFSSGAKAHSSLILSGCVSLSTSANGNSTSLSITPGAFASQPATMR